MRKIIVILLIFLTLSSFTQEVIVTDRPDLTESALTVLRGAFQIESGIKYDWSGSYNDKTSFFSLPTTLLRYGLNDIFELRFQADYMTFDDYYETISGFGDFSFGMKAHLYSSDKIDMAFIATAMIPSGSKNFRNPRASFTGLFSLSHNLTDAISLGYNAGLSYDAYKNLNLIYSVASGFSITDKLSAFVEIFGNWHQFNSAAVSCDFGFTYLINNNLQLDASYGKGINYQTNFLSLGISWRILPN